MDRSNYRDHVAEVVSQVAVHLHNSLGTVGTALFDQHGSLVIDNNASHYARESTLSYLAANCLCKSSLDAIECHPLDDVTAFTAPLNSQYVFVVVGNHLEAGVIERFLLSLRRMLPEIPTDD